MESQQILSNIPLSNPISILGLVTALYKIYQFSSFFALHFAHRSTLLRFRHHKDPKQTPWALVTGSSDGIGKGFAEELCERGFNVVIHGRNAAKLEGVKAELKERYPKVEIRVAVLDVHPVSEKALDEMVASLSDLYITVLVNNVGGSGPIKPVFRQFPELAMDEADTLFGINAAFPTRLTAKMLPALKTRQPSLVINVGSFTGRMPSPYLSVYAGTKAYIESWSQSLGVEMKAEALDVEILGLIVGEVQASWRRDVPTNFMRCSSRKLAYDALNKVGCGQRIVTPYIGHAIGGVGLDYMPEWLADKILSGVAKTMKAEDEKIAKGG